MEWKALLLLLPIILGAVAGIGVAYSVIALFRMRRQLRQQASEFTLTISTKNSALQMIGRLDPEVGRLLALDPESITIHVAGIGGTGPNIATFLAHLKDAPTVEMPSVSVPLESRREIVPLIRVLQARRKLDPREDEEETWPKNQQTKTQTMKSKLLKLLRRRRRRRSGAQRPPKGPRPEPA